MRAVSERYELFVYGTLMRGGHHHELMDGAEWLADAETLPVYDLVLIDYFPAMVTGGSTRVRGELYHVDHALLTRLDALEEVPHYYVRERIRLADGRSADSYLMPRERVGLATPILSGDFRIR